MNDPNISTLTAITSIDMDIDIEKLNTLMNTLPIGIVLNNVCPVHSKKPIKVFKNQVQLHIPVQGTKSVRQVKVKVFNNGRLHITGAQSLNMVGDVLSSVNTFLHNGGIIPTRFNEQLVNDKVSIVMINMTIDAGFMINQRVFRDILINKYNMYSEFNPKTYAGINTHYEMNYTKRASFLIFQSGKINIAGAKGVEYLMSAKQCIETILAAEKKEIMIQSEM